MDRTFEAQLTAEGEWLSVTQVCRATPIDFAVVIELAELGVVSPRGSQPQEWQLLFHRPHAQNHIIVAFMDHALMTPCNCSIHD